MNTKRILALALVALMLVSTCVFANASASVSVTSTGSYDVVSGVKYQSYSVYGSQSRHTETMHTLQFNPEDGYIAIPYTQYAGNVATISSQVAAAKAAGYEVVGAINGAFFDMTSGTPYGTIMSNGVLNYSALWAGCGTGKPGTNGENDELVTFGYDGSIELVHSWQDWNIDLNGVAVPAGVVNINRHHNPAGAAADIWLSNQVYYYDRSCGTYTDTSSSYRGVEVVCEKINNTEIMFGSTLKGKVVSVTTNTYGSDIGENQFVLFALTGGDYYNALVNLKAGDPVSVSTINSVSGANEILQNKAGAMYHCGSLVKNGADLTDSYSEIGDTGHSVTSTYSSWAAFGTKADGTVVLMTTTGGSTGDSSRSLTLKDVAAALINLGCTNVYRCDGGGSVGMYVDGEGYVQVSEDRSVTDVVLVVKKSSLANAALNTELRAQIDTAKTLVTDVPSLQTLIDKGEALLAAGAAAGEIRPTLAAITEAVINNTSLEGLIDRVNALDVTKYSEDVLATVRPLYETAVSLVNAGNTTGAQATKCFNDLKAALAKEGEGDLNTIAVVPTFFNTSIAQDNANIFTPAFGTVTSTNANHNWTVNILLEWDSTKECYIVKSANTNEAWGDNGAQTPPEYALADGQLLLAVHGENTVVNRQMAAQVQVGDEARLYGIDVDNATIGTLGYIRFGELAEVEEPTPTVMKGDVNGDGVLKTGDYTVLKRAVMGTYTIADEFFAAADINGDGVLKTGDYTVLKRAVMGTYTIPQE